MTFRWLGKSTDGMTITLKHVSTCLEEIPDSQKANNRTNDSENLRTGIIIDIETTGLNQVDDEIIELGVRKFLFDRNSGEILELIETYSSLQDPGKTLSPEISQLTGLTNELLEGKNIDWNHVHRLFEDAAIVIAHNAKFDRPFIDKKLKLSSQKIWACSLKHIDWNKKGFPSSKLELLNIYHGFFTDSHRALNDVDALTYLLNLPDENSKRPYLLELLENARRPLTQIIASSTPYETKDLLKTRSYYWDSTNRYWAKSIYKDEVSSEIKWLENEVYGGVFKGLTRDIPLIDNFKNTTF